MSLNKTYKSDINQNVKDINVIKNNTLINDVNAQNLFLDHLYWQYGIMNISSSKLNKIHENRSKCFAIKLDSFLIDYDDEETKLIIQSK